MRKTLAIVLMATTFVVASAAPALALRDPFDPVVTAETETGTTTDTTTDTSTTGQETTDTTDEVPFSDGMPTTGSDPSSWLVLSYALVVAGGGAIVLARTLRPGPARS